MELKQEKDIIENWKNYDLEKPLVSIICHAFNHENYVSEALDGFLMQETDFPFEIIIHEDASTDKTKNVIKEYELLYPNIVKPIYQTENQYSKWNIGANITYPASKGKYIAMCEGDDYWIDNYKLQKQVDFLEKNPEYVVTWTNFQSKDGNKIIETGYEEKYPDVYDLDLENVFDYYITYTLTVLFKKEAIDYKRINEFKYAKDNTFYALLLVNGKGAFLNFKSAIYRWHSGGVFSLRSEFFKKYSSYKNIKEIYERIDEAKTKSMKFIYTELYKQAAEEALKMYSKREVLTKEQKDVLKNHFKSLRFKEKIRFIKKYFKFKNN